MSAQIVDFSLLQDCDILVTTCPEAISECIRGGEVWAEDRRLEKSILESLIDASEASTNPSYPSHELLVYDIKNLKGAEMTWPKPDFCDLNDYVSTDPKAKGDHTVQVFRCPWLSEKHNPKASDLREGFKEWMASEIAKGEGYGIDNLFAFLNLCKEDFKHLTCSLWATTGLILNVQEKGFDCNFPYYWIVEEPDTGKKFSGLVSPWGTKKEFNWAGWGIPYKVL